MKNPEVETVNISWQFCAKVKERLFLPTCQQTTTKNYQRFKKIKKISTFQKMYLQFLASSQMRDNFCKFIQSPNFFSKKYFKIFFCLFLRIVVFSSH
jgi:hypothetical protein